MTRERQGGVFVTIASRSYLINVVALLRSLAEHAPDAQLILIAYDEDCAAAARRLDLGSLMVVPAASIEASRPDLALSRRTRSVGEHCWTLTPFALLHALELSPEAPWAAYLDADLLLLSDPVVEIEAMRCNGRSVLLTPHAYAPEYAWLARSSGTYCIQFLAVMPTPPARALIAEWGERCIAWCHARNEPGRCGDQFHVEDWPSEHPNLVHLPSRPERFLGPWNARHAFACGITEPVAYHFHGCRLLPAGRLQLHSGFRIGAAATPLYERYRRELASAADLMRRHGLEPDAQLPAPGLRRTLRNRLWSLCGRYAEVALERTP